MRKRLTPNQKVLRRYPDAVAIQHGVIRWTIMAAFSLLAKRLSGTKRTEDEAWADAARRMK